MAYPATLTRPPSGSTASAWSRSGIMRGAPWAALPLSVLLLGWSFSYAGTHSSGQAQFTIFWLGIAIFVTPAAARLLAGASLSESRLLVVALALLLSVPKFLRNPDFPLFHDEFAHWRQVEEILRTHHLLHTNYTIYVIGEFPGLHALTAGISDITGLSAWRSGQIVVLICHIAALLGVFEIARRLLGGSARSAGVAAFIYATNPSYMFFDAQFAYESLAIVMFIWLVLAVARLSDPTESRPGMCLGFVILLSGATVITHHISAVAEIGVLTGGVILASWRLRTRSGSGLLVIRLVVALLVAVVFAAAWTVFVAPNVVGYLAPHVTQGFSQISGIVARKQSSRGVFKASPLPGYEQFSGIGAVVLAAAIVGYAVVVLVRSGRLRPPGLLPLMAVLALVYFASLPLILTSAGTEAAHRSWGFSFVGVAIMGGVVSEDLLNRLGAHHVRTAVRTLSASGALVALMIMLIGNVASSVNESYRFPGPFIWGSGTRSTDAEVVGLAKAFRRRYGANRKVVTDAYSALSFAAYGDAQTAQSSGGFPIWQLYFDVTTPPQLLRELKGSGWQFVVVDERMPFVHPLLEAYVSSGEHLPGRPDLPPSRAAFAKFGRVPWLRRVMQSNHFAVYEFDYAVLKAGEI